jgi:acetyl esterase/lipase
MIKKHLLLTSVIALSVVASAQELTLPLWPAGKIPNAQKTSETERRDSSNIISISRVQNPEIAIFFPAKRNATGQAVVICPGGGYGILAYDWEGTDIAKWFNSKGVTAIVLKYRLPNPKSNIVPHQSPLMDAQRAIRMVRANANKWNLKTDKVGIMGFSAGGHLASTAGTHFDNGNTSSPDSVERFSSRPDFMILMYPVITMSKATMHSGSKNNLIGEKPDAQLANFYSAELNVTKETPPTFFAHATDDKSVPVENSLMLYQALKDKAIPAEMHIYPKGGHGFGLALGIPATESWTDRCIDWLRALNK